MVRSTHNRKPPTKAAPKKKKEPETFDELLAAGIDLEEQGERYATGERAQRYYEKAAAMYGKAHNVDKSDADCLYNWGHVLFILVGMMPTHTTPEEKLEKVDGAIDKFRGALRLEQNKVDAQFNLAQALHQRSEILQETTEIDNAYSQSALALQEAMSLFEEVYKVQEEEYTSQNTQQQEAENEQSEVTHEEQPSEQGESHAHDNSEQAPSEVPSSSEAPSTSEAPNTSNQQQDFTTVTQVEPTTAYSLIETLVALADTMTTMASMLASYQSSVDLFSRARAKLSLAEKWLSETSESDKEHKQCLIQLSLKEAQNFAALAERSFIASGRVDHATFEQAMQRLDNVITRLDDRHVETLCDKGDVLSNYAQAILKEETKRQGGKLDAETTGKQVWQLFSQADKSYKAALQQEPKNLNLLNKMGELSVIRARLETPTAERNRVQLLKNAEFYYKQAVEIERQLLTNGWIGWAFSAWALETWAKQAGKKDEAGKIIHTWIKRGGSGDLFSDITEDNEFLDEAFVSWVMETYFDQDTSDESE